MNPTAPLILLLTLLFVHASQAAPTLSQGYDAFERGDITAAIKIWTTLAEQGDTTAQVNLGQLYRQGRGVAQNDRTAVKWYSMAAQQGSETAQFNLLIMQKEGRATEEELVLAFARQDAGAEQARKSQTGIAPSTAVAKDSGKSKAQTTPAPTAQPYTQPPAVTATKTDPAVTASGTKLSTEETWLWQTPARHYVVQVFASSNMKRVEEYAVRHLDAYQSQLRVAHTSNQGRNWFLLLIGPIATHGETNTTLQHLPPATQRDKPWARSVQSIQKAVAGRDQG